MKIFCIGDCFTSGYDPFPKEKPQDFSNYPNFLQEILLEKEIEVVNMGRSMMTLVVLKEYPNVTVPKEIDIEQDIILLWCGQNDLALEKSAKETFTLYLEYYDKFKDAGLKNKIIHITSFPRKDIDHGTPLEFEENRIIFNNLLISTFSEKVIDLGNSDEIILNGELKEEYSTGFPDSKHHDHLNKEGNKKVAEIISEYILKIL